MHFDSLASHGAATALSTATHRRRDRPPLDALGFRRAAIVVSLFCLTVAEHAGGFS